MNIFEGARRIALVIAGIIVIGSGFAIYGNEPYVSVAYRVNGYNQPPVESRACTTGIDKLEFESFRTPNDTPYSVNLCFAGQYSKEQGRAVIPVLESDQGVWLAGLYTPEAERYIETYVRDQFKLSDAALKQIDEQYAHKRRSGIIAGILMLGSGLAFFWAVVWVLGWIVRGFLGIPRGQDTRPRATA